MLCFWFSLDCVVPGRGRKLEGSKVYWAEWNLQSCVQILQHACSLCKYTGVQGRYILKPEDTSELLVWRHPGVRRGPARSQKTGGLTQWSEELQSRDKSQEVLFQESGGHLSGCQENPYPEVRSGPCSRALQLKAKLAK